MDQLKLTRAAEIDLTTHFGVWNLICYTSNHDAKEHLALIMGQVTSQERVLTRVHSECLTGDVFGSQHCDCGEQLHTAMQLIADQGQGIILYLRQEGRGIGLLSKLRAYQLLAQGYDTIDANKLLGYPVDARTYEVAVHILRDIQVASLNLLTNNPLKVEGLVAGGIPIHQVTSMQPTVYPQNRTYLQTKAARMGHTLNPHELE